MKFIEVEELKKEICKSPVWTGLDAIARVNAMDTIDIVKCVDCKKCKEQGGHANCNGYLYCTRQKTMVDEDCFCCWGERKSDE